MEVEVTDPRARLVTNSDDPKQRCRDLAIKVAMFLAEFGVFFLILHFWSELFLLPLRLIQTIRDAYCLLFQILRVVVSMWMYVGMERWY